MVEAVQSVVYAGARSESRNGTPVYVFILTQSVGG